MAAWNQYIANPRNRANLAQSWDEYAHIRYNLGLLAGYDPFYGFLTHPAVVNAQNWKAFINTYWQQATTFADAALTQLKQATIDFIK